MLKIGVRIAFILVGGALGILFLPHLFELFEVTSHPFINNPYTAAVIGASIFICLAYFLAERVVDSIKWLEQKLLKAPILDLIFGTGGLMVGLLVAYLLSFGIAEFNIKAVTSVVPIILLVLFGYLGFQVGFQKREEFMNAIFSAKKAGNDLRVKEEAATTSANHKVLDTSVIIDGRILDIVQTGFVEGILVIPQFVLTELQHIADSSDNLKRVKGRRGLDILKQLQVDEQCEVQITTQDYDDIAEVDLKLVRLAKDLNGAVVTNDYNLNKVAAIHGVQVLNINDLSNAVKPVVIPGEDMHVVVVKEGKEQNQGVAYLDDGTMIVVEGGRKLIGEAIDVVVTSVLQTSAGRMIFAKPKA